MRSERSCFSPQLGYKFETLSLIPNHWDSTPREFIEKRGELTVNNYAQYCSVVKTGIGKTKLIIGGEVDARKPHRQQLDYINRAEWF